MRSAPGPLAPRVSQLSLLIMSGGVWPGHWTLDREVHSSAADGAVPRPLQVHPVHPLLGGWTRQLQTALPPALSVWTPLPVLHPCGYRRYMNSM